MLKFFRKLFSGAIPSRALTVNNEVMSIMDIVVSNEDVLQVSQYVTCHHGYPIVDWDALSSWCNNLVNQKLEAEIWTKVERMCGIAL